MNPYRYGDDQNFMGPPAPADIARLKKRQGQPFFVGPPAPQMQGQQDPATMSYAAQQAGEAPQGPPSSPWRLNPQASMNPGDIQSQYGQLTSGMPLQNPGSRAEIERKSTQGQKFGSVRNLLRSPNEVAMMDAMARGQRVQQATDERGQPKVQFNPVTGESEPIYETTGETDPDSPVVQQQQGLTDLQGMAHDILKSRRPGTDMSAVAAYIDAQTGSHFAQSYTKPNNEHMVDDAVGLAEKIQERRKDIATAINQEKQRMTGAGSFTDMMSMALADKLGLGQRTPAPRTAGNDQDRWNKWYGKLQSDPGLKGANDANGYLTKALSMIKTNNPVAFFNSKIEVLRSMGIGSRVTNMELANEPGAQDFISKWNQALQTMTEGDWTPENQKKYVTMLTDLAQEQKRLVQSIHAYHRQSGIEGYGLDPGKVDRQLGARERTPVFDIKPGEPKDDAKSAEMKKLMDENKKIEDILNKHGGTQ